MSRGLAAANATESATQSPIPVTFVHFGFSSGGGDQYLHDWIGPINWPTTNPSIDWLGVGDLGSVGIVQEGEEISPYEISLQVSGMEFEGDLLDEAINQNYRGDAVNIYIGWLNATQSALIEDPDLYWAGFIDQMNVNVDGEIAAIEVIAESEMAIMNKANGAMFSNSEQQARYSGDTFFQYVPQMKNLELTWGGKTINVGGNGGGWVDGRPGDGGGNGGGFR